MENDSIKMKDDQIKTLNESIKLKEDQIKTLNESLKLKEDLQKSKDEKIKELTTQLADQKTSEEFENLQKEIEILNNELTTVDEEIEQLELENEKLRKEGSQSPSIIDFSDYHLEKSVVTTKMAEILQNAKHNVTIAVPTILDLQELYLFEVRSSVNLKISCLIHPGLKEHSDLIEELDTMDNISLRHFDNEDRYVILRDGEELLFALKGNKESNLLIFHTKDSAHINALNNLVMERWLRSRKIE